MPYTFWGNYPGMSQIPSKASSGMCKVLIQGWEDGFLLTSPPWMCTCVSPTPHCLCTCALPTSHWMCTCACVHSQLPTVCVCMHSTLLTGCALCAFHSLLFVHVCTAHSFCSLTAGAPVAKISVKGLSLWLKDELKPGSPKLFSKKNVTGAL